MMIIIQKKNKQNSYIYLLFINNNNITTTIVRLSQIHHQTINQQVSWLMMIICFNQLFVVVVCLVDDYIINTNETLTYCTIYTHIHMMRNKKKKILGNHFHWNKKKKKGKRDKKKFGKWKNFNGTKKIPSIFFYNQLIWTPVCVCVCAVRFVRLFVSSLHAAGWDFLILLSWNLFNTWINMTMDYLFNDFN